MPKEKTSACVDVETWKLWKQANDRGLFRMGALVELCYKTGRAAPMPDAFYDRREPKITIAFHMDGYEKKPNVCLAQYLRAACYIALDFQP